MRRRWSTSSPPGGSDAAAVAHRRMSFADTPVLGPARCGRSGQRDPGTRRRGGPRHLVARTEFFRRPLPTGALASLMGTSRRGASRARSGSWTSCPGAARTSRVPPDATAFVHREGHFQLKPCASSAGAPATREPRPTGGSAGRGRPSPWGSSACSRASPTRTSRTGPRPTTAQLLPAGPRQGGVRPEQRVSRRPVAACVNGLDASPVDPRGSPDSRSVRAM